MPLSLPNFTPLPTRIILDGALPPALFRSFCRLYAAAWGHGYACTGPLDFEAEVAPLLGLSRTQARQHLRSLRLAGLVTWISDGAHRYTFHFNTPIPDNDGRPQDESGKAESRTQPTESGKAEIRTRLVESEKPDIRTRSTEPGTPEESEFPEIRTLEEVKEGDCMDLISSSKLASGFPDPARILAATPSLFGEPVLGPPSRYPDARLLLAHIAAAYAERRRLKHPARVAYANLEKGLPPDPVYLADPAAALPPEFLRHLGLAGPADPEPDPEPAGDPGPAEPGLEAEPEPPDPSLNLPVAPLGPAAASAWQTAAAQLEVEMPRATYSQYVRPARLAGYDPLSNTFTVLAANAYARDWLEDRLTSTLVRLLTGICNRGAGVRFTAPASQSGVLHRRPPPDDP